MFGGGSLREIASAQSSSTRKRLAAPNTRRAIKALAAIMSTALLAACSGPLPFLGGAASDQQAANAHAPGAAKPKRMRTTARDILAEWGTFGLEQKSPRKVPTTRVALTRVSLALPEYSLSLQELMANAACRLCEQKPYHRMVEHASNLHGVPSGLIHAVIRKESGYNPRARSHRNALGLMQVTPATGRFMGVESSQTLYDPQTNINAGTAYLKYLMLNHDTVEEVLAAYNAGPGNVRKYNGVPPFSETRRYVVDVKNFYASTASEEK
jgi:soluble lytic murein transglycosylase-like protein